MTDNSTYYSIIVVKPNGLSSTLRIRKSYLYALLSVVAVSIITIAISAYISLNSSIQLTDYESLKELTESQDQFLASQDHKLNELQIELESLLEKEEELRLILGDVKPTTSKYRQYKSKKKSKKLDFRNAYTDLAAQQTSKIEMIAAKTQFLKDSFSQSILSFNDTLERAYHFKSRFALTPSLMPVYGRILSGYGMRTHPIKGVKRFHKGIDIAAWSGSPIQATADGLVEYAGWSGSFGFVVVLNHDFGYRTIYAHCSKLLTSKNEFVKKGQIIAQVGQTGLSTGSHLHYEVKKWKNSLNPKKFLNLDMFTASTEIW